jgi:putative ubiquitin-RnfH superfamily antitoxin RatB of RatAB toxin-antitoxin module
MGDAPLRVVVVYSPGPRDAREVLLQLPAGCSVVDAVRSSHLISHLPDHQLDTLTLAVWGRKASPLQLLRNEDRVEICRPLRVDPKVARRERFTRQGSKGTGLFASRRPGAKAGY